MVEIDVGQVSKAKLKDLMLSLFGGEVDFFVIRDVQNAWDRKEWFEFLKSECQFVHDARHFDFSENLAISDWWEISYQPDKATSYAYSNTFQPFHTDNAWFSDPAPMNFFYMEKQADQGGEQYLYPLKELKKDLQNEAPGLFQKLTTKTVTIQKGNTDLKHETSIIDLDSDEIYWNYYRTHKEDAEVNSMCEEFFEFLGSKQESPSVVRLRCNSGDCFAFNDLKLLHARNGFKANEAFDRVLYQSMWRAQ